MRTIAILLVALHIPPIAADEPKSDSKKPSRYEFKVEHDPNGIGKFYMDREIALVMGHTAASWLERATREEEEQPKKLIKALKIEPGLIIADIGAGSGYHAFRLAPLVGEKGKVLAVDIQPEMIDIVKARMKKDKVENIETILSKEDDPKLPDNAVDMILMVDVYHEFAYPYEMTEKMIKALKPGGRLVFVEFKKEDPKVPIKEVHKMSERQVIKEMDEFKELKHVETNKDLPWQHVITFKKVEKK